jgi:hypothetical protein
MCYSNAARRVIERITITTTASGQLIQTDHAFGAWADRATLEYIPINDTLTE